MVFTKAEPVLSCLKLITNAARIRLIVFVGIQVTVGFLDLIAILLSSILAKIVIEEQARPNLSSKVGSIPDFQFLNRLSEAQVIYLLTASIVLLMITKTLFSAFFTRYVMNYLSKLGAEITNRYLLLLIDAPITFINSGKSQNTIFALTKGVESIVLFVIANIFIIVSDCILLLLLFTALLYLDLFSAISSLIVFGLFGYLLMRYMHTRALTMGQLNTKLNIESDSSIIDLLSSFREILVSGRKTEIVNKIGYDRFAVGRSFAQLTFLPYISKYVIELSIIVGAVFVALATIIFREVPVDFAAVAVFILSSTRITPALLRIQQGWISMRSNLGVAEPALRLIDTLNQYECRVEKFEVSKDINLDFIPSVTLSHVSFFYPEKSTPAVNDFNLEILPGKFVALVGPSGGGKSTLVDLILGVLSPTSGEVRISSLTPHQAIKLSPGAIGFVPQRSVILNRSIRENIALGVPLSAISEEQVSRAIQIAELNSFVESLPQGLDTILQEQGANLSGGQRQRLGIARALYTNPKLIVFDEATSSLDVLTEREITNSLLSLKGEATIIVIAHRLSTVVNADVIYYIDNGFLVASGNFDNLQKLVPGFGQ